MWLYHRVMSPKDADGMENSVDPGQAAAPLGAVWSGSTVYPDLIVWKLRITVDCYMDIISLVITILLCFL